MKIVKLDNGNGRDLYGTLECEHCGAHDVLTGGYNDHFWHTEVLPAYHCVSCGKNREGNLRSAEVTAANQAKGVNVT